jgi:hypothetical protein
VAEVVEATHAHIRDELGSLEARAHRRAVERAAVASAEHEIAACSVQWVNRVVDVSATSDVDAAVRRGQSESGTRLISTRLPVIGAPTPKRGRDPWAG